jgi:tetratricopeptide (TPR) repeat protein
MLTPRRLPCGGSLKTTRRTRKRIILYGWLLYDFRDYRPALDQAQMAVSLDPKASAYHLLLGKCYGAELRSAGVFQKLSIARRAKAEFKAAVNSDPGNLEARIALAGFLADTPAIAGGSVAQAFEQVDDIQKMDAVEGDLTRADLYVDQKKPTEAEREIQAALKSDPPISRIWSRAAILYIRISKQDVAYPLLEKALTLDGANAVAGYCLGKMDLEQGRNLDRVEKLLRLNLVRWPREGDVAWAQKLLAPGTISRITGEHLPGDSGNRDSAKAVARSEGSKRRLSPPAKSKASQP